MLSFIPMKAWLGLGAAVVVSLAVAWSIHAFRDNAVLKERARIDGGNAAVRDAADGGEREFKACPVGKWNWSKNKCDE
jgi:hypothetical protein